MMRRAQHGEMRYDDRRLRRAIEIRQGHVAGCAYARGLPAMARLRPAHREAPRRPEGGTMNFLQIEDVHAVSDDDWTRVVIDRINEASSFIPGDDCLIEFDEVDHVTEHLIRLLSI